ncbi:MAG: hypothetical protein ACI95S_001756 [Dinoroseobacter sp.]|jgi:hypothetical protein
MPLIGASVLFALFVINVAMGAFFNASFLGDVGELLVLLATTILFVVVILQKEADAKK